MFFGNLNNVTYFRKTHLIKYFKNSRPENFPAFQNKTMTGELSPGKTNIIYAVKTCKNMQVNRICGKALEFLLF